MGVKISTLLFVLTAICTFGQAVPKPTSGVAIPGFTYIHDAKMFKPEGAKDLTAEARRAVRFARGIITLRLEGEVEGEFSVAEAAWGYQVNFWGLKIKRNGVWTETHEGFGEVFLNKALDKIEINYGP
jgi:hypothetical protein